MSPASSLSAPGPGDSLWTCSFGRLDNGYGFRTWLRIRIVCLCSFFFDLKLEGIASTR